MANRHDPSKAQGARGWTSSSNPKGQRKAGHLRKMAHHLLWLAETRAFGPARPISTSEVAHTEAVASGGCARRGQRGRLRGHRGTIFPCPSEINGPHSKLNSNVFVVGANRSHGADCGPKSAPRQRPDHAKKEAFFTFSTKNVREMKRAANVWRWACGGMTNESI